LAKPLAELRSGCFGKPSGQRDFFLFTMFPHQEPCVRTPLEEFVPGSSWGVLLHTVFDEGTSVNRKPPRGGGSFDQPVPVQPVPTYPTARFNPRGKTLPRGSRQNLDFLHWEFHRESSLLKTPFAMLKFCPRSGRGRWPHTLKNPCFFDPMPKFKWRISGAPKNLDQ